MSDSEKKNCNKSKEKQQTKKGERIEGKQTKKKQKNSSPKQKECKNKVNSLNIHQKMHQIERMNGTRREEDKKKTLADFWSSENYQKKENLERKSAAK